MSELEHFRLKSSDLGRMTGVSLAVHAIPDAFLLMHCGVGCKHKATSQITSHDRAHAIVARGWTEVGDAELIEGSADRIGPYLRSWHDRLKPGLIAVISVTFLDLTGDDFKDAVRECDDELPCEVMFVPAAGTDGDLHEGYANLVVELVGRLDWSVAVSKPKSVSVLGYFWDRYEGDHVGNLQQLGSLLRSLGLELGPVLLSGEPVDALRSAPESGTLLAFPHLHKRVRRLKRLCRREPTAVDLPMGLSGTARWLREVGAAAGVDSARVAAVVAARERQLEEPLGIARMALMERRVAVFADLPLAAGIVAVLHDLAMVPAVVGIRGSTLGGAEALRERVARDGLSLDGVEILEDPSIHAVREAVREQLEAGQLDGIIGSATDFNGITTLPPETFGAKPFALEAGYPCKRYHVLRPTPTLGYAGLLAWADRILNAPRLWDDGR